MQKILVEEKEKKHDAWIFKVKVGDGDDATVHSVAVPKAYWGKLTGGKMPPIELMRKSFEFLLRREPKESILREFELPIIQKYFTEYETEIQNTSQQT
jgi:hypothetical protein